MSGENSSKLSSVPSICALLLISLAGVLKFYGDRIDPWALPPKRPFVMQETALPSLVNVKFPCAEAGGLLSRIELKIKAGNCSTALTAAVTRCPQFLPMTGFGDKVHCPSAEKMMCPESGLQVIGLFKGDAYCSTSKDVDLGPPRPIPRTED